VSLALPAVTAEFSAQLKAYPRPEALCNIVAKVPRKSWPSTWPGAEAHRPDATMDEAWFASASS
jgi:hypothetical protein